MREFLKRRFGPVVRMTDGQRVEHIGVPKVIPGYKRCYSVCRTVIYIERSLLPWRKNKRVELSMVVSTVDLQCGSSFSAKRIADAPIADLIRTVQLDALTQAAEYVYGTPASYKIA